MLPPASLGPNNKRARVQTQPHLIVFLLQSYEEAIILIVLFVMQESIKSGWSKVKEMKESRFRLSGFHDSLPQSSSRTLKNSHHVWDTSPHSVTKLYSISPCSKTKIIRDPGNIHKHFPNSLI